MDYEKRKRFIVNLAYIGLIVLLGYVVLHYGFGLLMPFLLAFVVAYLLRTPARFLARKTNLPYKPIVLILVLLFYGTIGLLASLLGIKAISYLADFISRLPLFYSNQIEPSLSSFFDNIEQLIYHMDPTLMTALSDMFTESIRSLGETISNLSVRIVGTISGYATSLPGLLIKMMLMLISTFFIAGDYEILSGFVMRQFSGKGEELFIRIKEYVVGTLFVCIRSYAIIMSITFFELSIGLTLINIPNAIVIAFLIAIFDILPVLGTGGIMIPWVVVTAVQGNELLAVSLLILYAVITVIRNIIEPKIVGSQIGLHPIVTLMSMFLGVQLFGAIGLFGFPITLSLLRHLNDTGTIKIFK